MKQLFLVLAVFALPAAAQAPAPQSAEKSTPPATQPQQKPAAPLILRLDEIEGPRMSFGPSASEKPAAQELPSLGGGTRPLPPSPSSERAIPKDTAPGH